MDKLVKRSDFQYCEMNIDSAYMALSDSDLPDHPEVKADTDVHWFLRTRCTTHAKHYKPTSGLFKLEYEEHIIGLCSKAQIAFQTKSTQFSNAVTMAHSQFRKALKSLLKHLRELFVRSS